MFFFSSTQPKIIKYLMIYRNKISLFKTKNYKKKKKTKMKTKVYILKKKPYDQLADA